MKRKRRTHSAEFKARVALEAIKGIRTINEIAQDEGVLPVQVSTWKKLLMAELSSWHFTNFTSQVLGRDLPPAMPVCAFGIPNAAVTTASCVPRFHRNFVPLWS